MMSKERILQNTIYLFFFFLAVSLVYTQVLRFGYYSKVSKNNSIRIIPIDGPRGNIFDRNGVALVTNRLSFDVALIYQELKDRNRLTALLCETLGVSRREVFAALEESSRTPYAPVTVFEDISKEKAIVLEEASLETRGLVIETRSIRHYLYDEAGCHVFGYLSEVDEDELEELRRYGYRMKDLIGRAGLERYYDRYLAGTSGGMQIEVDNRGRQTRVLGLKEPSSGKDLHLTIDASLERFCDSLLRGKKGAIIVMNPKNGEILALASHTGFDPNVFVKPEGSFERLKLVKDKLNYPLLNRSISGVYPPGSIFKVVVASAALETKKITSHTRFFCDGSYRLGNARFDCWKDSGHGSQDIKDGIMNSCNVVFYNTGRLAGVDAIESFAKYFGFGKPTGIDLPEEASGLVPGRTWKRLKEKGVWYEGETVNYAIGQGYLLVTPVQVLQMMALVANWGKLSKPHIVKRIDSTPISDKAQRSLAFKEGTVQNVREGLLRVVGAEGGTGRRASLEGLDIAGKTGTAENPLGETHAWFGGFAPYKDPDICLIVFLEHGGKGGLLPAEMAHDIFAEAKRLGYL